MGQRHWQEWDNIIVKLGQRHCQVGTTSFSSWDNVIVKSWDNIIDKIWDNVIDKSWDNVIDKSWDNVGDIVVTTILRVELH